MDGVTAEEVHSVLETGTTGNAVKDLAINAGLQEQWARAFENYLRDGKAPSIQLQGIFRQFQKWLVDIYRSALDLNVKMSDEIKGVFDRILAAEDALPKERAPAKAVPPRPIVASMPVNVQNEMDFSPPKDQPPSPDLLAAQSRVGKPEDMVALAKQHGVDLVTGDYNEQFEVDALRETGRTTPEEEAALLEADMVYKEATEYGNALKAALACEGG